jgi:hypothetical protein
MLFLPLSLALSSALAVRAAAVDVSSTTSALQWLKMTTVSSFSWSMLVMMKFILTMSSRLAKPRFLE